MKNLDGENLFGENLFDENLFGEILFCENLFGEIFIGENLFGENLIGEILDNDFLRKKPRLVKLCYHEGWKNFNIMAGFYSLVSPTAS